MEFLVCYTHDLIKYAKQLDELIVVDYNEKTFKFSVSIPSVWYKENKTYLKLSINGLGFTIEDACNDFLRKCRGHHLVHIFNNKSVSPI